MCGETVSEVRSVELENCRVVCMFGNGIISINVMQECFWTSVVIEL